jgi:hypothetical protein
LHTNEIYSKIEGDGIKEGQVRSKLQITFAGMLHCWLAIPTSWYQLTGLAICGNEVPCFLQGI